MSNGAPWMNHDDRDEIYSFWGNDGGYSDMMARVGNLPDGRQEAYQQQSPSLGVEPPRGYIQPANDPGELDWWNNYTPPKSQATGKKKPKRGTKGKTKAPATRTKRPEDSDSSEYVVPLVNLEAPSPLLWVCGIALIMTITFVCETFQIGGYSDIKKNPMWGPDESTMLQMGAKYGPLILAGDWWRLFSATFLQNGLIFYVVSMVLLFITRNVEREAGWWRAMFAFMISGTFGYIVSCLFVPEVISCGTTGALCGYIGLMVSDLIAKWRGVSRPALRLIGLIVLTAILIVLGLTPYVDNFLHIGGLVMGFLLALILLPNLNFGKCEGIVHSIIAFLAFPAMSTLFMVCLVIFFRGVESGTSWCSWCIKATCININGWCKDLY